MLQQVFAAVEKTGFAALGELGADRRRSIERRDPGAGGAHPLGQCPLRRKLRLDQTLIDIFGQDQPLRGTRWCGEGADHLFNLPVDDHLPHVGCVGRQGGTAARRIRHASQILGTLLGDGLVEVDRHPDNREPAETDRGSVRDVANRIVETCVDLALGAHSPA